MTSLPAPMALDKNVSQFDRSERDRIARAVVAKNLGLPPEQFALPFPTSNMTVNMSSNETTAPKRSLLGPLLGTALVAGALGAGGPLLYDYLNKSPAKPQPSAGSNYDSTVKVEVLPPEESK